MKNLGEKFSPIFSTHFLADFDNMNSKIDIKICNIDMLTDLQYLCRTTFYETFSDSTDEEDMRKFLAETYSAEKLSAELANSESVTFIAYKNGTPLGYLKLNIGNAQTEKCLDNALEIQRIYILKSAKGHGIGSAFMQIAENFASEKKLSTIWLGVWEHNEPAKKFYKSKGYEKFSHHTFVIGDDMQTDFLLKKEIL